MHEATAEHPMEVSSIATYLSKLKGGLKELDQEMSFEDMDPDEWLQLQELNETGEMTTQAAAVDSFALCQLLA